MLYDIEEAKRHLDIAKDRLWITAAEYERILCRLTGKRHHEPPVDHETKMPGVYTYRVIPCWLRRDHHQIRKIGPDGSSHLIASIDNSIAEAELLAIARILATPTPIEIEREEYYP